MEHKFCRIFWTDFHFLPFFLKIFHLENLIPFFPLFPTFSHQKITFFSFFSNFFSSKNHFFSTFLPLSKFHVFPNFARECKLLWINLELIFFETRKFSFLGKFVALFPEISSWSSKSWNFSNLKTCEKSRIFSMKNRVLEILRDRF